MKTIFTFILFSGILVVSQGAEIKGKIYLDHDTLNVTLKVPLGLFNREPVLHNLRSKIIYLNKKGERKVLKAKDAKEVVFQYERETIRLVSRPHPSSINKRKPRYYFLKLEEDGMPLKLFIFYDETTSDDNMNTDYVEQYYIQKNEQPMILVSGINFRKIMLEIVSDCPEVAEKIDKREWKKRDINKIVQFYNQHAQTSL